jgi:3-hydroxy-9,10-secoandrosta-1,3,5(10)-triene-9,17-dione monooxygenase
MSLAQPLHTTDTPPTDDDAATLLANARALQPVLRARCADAEAARQIPAETIADFHEAGFWRMLQPRRWGGLEVHPRTFFEVQQLVAAACPSSAWVLGVVAVHNWQLALFDPRAQEEVWGEDTRVLVSSSYAPTGKVERVEGGYRISGRWSFSSGVDHCGWSFLGGFAPTESGPPDMRTFLVPRADLRIDDTWHTIALKGTGSKDVVVDGAFVPEHRTHKMTDGFRCQSPGNALNDAPLYRMPFGQIFTRSVSTTSLGIARGALDFYLDVTATKVGAADGNPAAKSAFAQLAVARATSTLDQLRLAFERDLDELMAAAERGERLPIERRVALRWNSSEAVGRCVEVVDELFGLCGARALFLDSPMHRYFVDVHGARAHYANRPEASGTNLGRVALGQPTQDWFL